MMNQEERTRWSNIFVAVGMLLMVVMALMPLLDINRQWMRWVFAAGAVIVLLARVLAIDNTAPLRIKRLHRILISSGILYCASALMMFLSRGSNDWIAFLLAGVVAQFYASWMIDRENKKTEN